MNKEDMKLIKAVYENDAGTKCYIEEGAVKKTWQERLRYTWGSRQQHGYWKSWKNHREDGPAVILEDGTEKWYQHGVLHREDGPASYDKKGRPMYRLKGAKVPAMKVSQDKEALWHMMKHEKDGKTVD